MKFLFKDKLRADALEFNRMEDFLHLEYKNILKKMINTYGLIINTETGSDVWKPQQHETSNGGTPPSYTIDTDNILVNAGDAILVGQDGLPVALSLLSDTLVAIPAPIGTYNVFIQHQVTNYEDGTIALTNGSPNVYGVGTKFTEIFAAGRQLICNGAGYTILSITDDENLILTANYTGTNVSNVQFSVGGIFSTTPALVADRQVYQRDALEIIVTTDDITDNQYWICQVTRENGLIGFDITDKRNQNLLSFYMSQVVNIVIPHTFKISGTISGTGASFLNSLIIPAPLGQSVNLLTANIILSGGSCIVKLTKTNGSGTSDITGFTGMYATTSNNAVTPSSPAPLSAGDIINLYISNITGSPQDLLVTLFIQYTITT